MTVARRVSQPRRIPGEPGIWILVLGDLVVFGVFFVVFLDNRAQAPGAFAASSGELHRNLGFVNTIVLLCSSACVAYGVGALRASKQTSAPHPSPRAARNAFTGAAVLGSVFVVVKLTEYVLLTGQGNTPTTNTFFLYYFILTGLHLLHLGVGMIILMLMVWQSRPNTLSDNRLAMVESGGCFWHVVDLLWIVLFPLLYLVR